MRCVRCGYDTRGQACIVCTVHDAMAELRTQIADLTAERAEVMALLDPSMPSSGLMDAVRQVLQVMALQASEVDALEKALATECAESTRLRRLL